MFLWFPLGRMMLVRCRPAFTSPPAYSTLLLQPLSRATFFWLSLLTKEVDVSAGVCKHNSHGKAGMLWEVRIQLSAGHPVLSTVFKKHSENYYRKDITVSTPSKNAYGTWYAVLTDNLPKAIRNVSGKLDVGCDNSCHLVLFSNRGATQLLPA